MESDDEFVYTPVKYTWKDNDDANLISMIHNIPTLWDPRRSDYRDTVKRQTIFMQMSCQFPGSTPGDVEKRFTALKEKYRREKKKNNTSTKSGSGVSNYRTWHLMPKMEFLGRTMKLRTKSFDPRRSSVSDESTCVESPRPIDNDISPQTSSPRRMHDNLFKRDYEGIKQIPDSAQIGAAQPKSGDEKKGNHFKIFEYIAEESSSMQPNRRSRFIRDVMNVFWKYKLDEI